MNKLKELRLEANMTVADLAKSLSVDEATIYRWEAGITTPRLMQYFKLKHLLGQDIDFGYVNTEQEVSAR